MNSNDNIDSESVRKRKVTEDPNFVNLKRFNYNLDDLLKRYPDEVPSNVIAAALMIEESDIESFYQNIVKKLQALMGVV